MQRNEFIMKTKLFFLYREVEMAHKVLPKDMHELVGAMKLAQQYNDTTLDVEYKKYVTLSYQNKFHLPFF